MRRLSLTLCGLGLLLLLAGCSKQPFANWQSTVLSPAYWAGETSSAPESATVSGDCVPIEKALAQGELERAHKLLLADAVHDCPDARRIRLYQILTRRLVADASRQQLNGQPLAAGLRLRMVMEGFREEDAAGIGISRRQIEQSLELAADSLMRRGLVSYRSGDLAAAIATWESIERFYPDHVPSQIAIQTASKQLQNLETLSGRQQAAADRQTRTGR